MAVRFSVKGDPFKNGFESPKPEKKAAQVPVKAKEHRLLWEEHASSEDVSKLLRSEDLPEDEDRRSGSKRRHRLSPGVRNLVQMSGLAMGSSD